MKNRNNMMRIFAFLLLTSMLVSSLAACNGVTITPNPVETTTTTTEKNDPDPNPDPDPKPHTCVFGHWEVVKAATTTEEGLRERRCECGEIEQEVIPCPEAEYSITYNNLKTADYPEVNGYNSADGLMNLPRPEATGYVFVGWYTSSVGGDIVDYIPKGSTKDYILFAHWELVEYTITYKNAPNYSGIMSYDIEDKLRLVSPKWSGLEFDYWSDEEGNKYYPDDDITTLPTYTHGDLVLTANWKVLRNIAKRGPENPDFYFNFDEEDGFLSFWYDIGTIEHVILDANPSAYLYYKAEGSNISLTLSKTVSIGEETAKTISNTISQSISTSKTIENSFNFAKSHSENWSNSITGGSETEVGVEGDIGVAKLSAKQKFSVEVSGVWGETDTSTAEWGSSVSSTTESSTEKSQTVSSSLVYKQDISSEISETFSVDANQPSGYYAYVHAGNIRVVAIVMYEIETGLLYINTHSYLDNMHSMLMYYPDVNALNNPTVDSLDLAIPEDKIVEMIESSYYVKYDGNGATGTMATTAHHMNEDEPISNNEFKKTGCIFAGWEMTTADGERIIVEDGAVIKDHVKPLQIVTLKALWETDPTYDKDIVYTATTKTGTISTSPGLTYSAKIEYRNRTADSVEVRIAWTTSIRNGSYTRYGQNFNFSVGSAKSGNVRVVSFDTWKNYTSSVRSKTGTSGWVTVPLNTPAATTISMKIYYWQTNSNDYDMNKYDGTAAINTTWKIDIPAAK